MYKKRIVTFILTFVLCMIMGVSVFAGEKNNVLSSNGHADEKLDCVMPDML